MSKNIKNKRKMIRWIILLVIAILLLSTHIVYAKYITIDKISAIYDVATPIFMIEGKDATQISETNNIGYYEFSIKNFNETIIGEIDFWYTIEIISNTDESIQFELYNEEEQIPLENLKTDPLSLKSNEKNEQKYKLKIIYDSTKAIENNDIFEEVQIRVYAEQEIK